MYLQDLSYVFLSRYFPNSIFQLIRNTSGMRGLFDIFNMLNINNNNTKIWISTNQSIVNRLMLSIRLGTRVDAQNAKV